VIYVGTGESCIRGNISYGDGVYKTTDGGKTWSHVGLTATQQHCAVWIDRGIRIVCLSRRFGHAYGRMRIAACFARRMGETGRSSL